MLHSYLDEFSQQHRAAVVDSSGVQGLTGYELFQPDDSWLLTLNPEHALVCVLLTVGPASEPNTGEQ